MTTFNDYAVAAGNSVGPAGWSVRAEALLERVGARFVRPEPRAHARSFVHGMLAELPRKNCWILAEHAGASTPDAMQHLLGRASWDTDGVREDLREFVVAHLGDPDGVLVVDETGDLKKGSATVGVQRQYTGTAGRIENAQVAVYLTYAGRTDHAKIDRELYLPRSWTSDPERLAQAGVPKGVGFATTPALAQDMIARTLAARVPARWVVGDEVYGADSGLRGGLEARRVGYVLGIGCDRRVTPSLAVGSQRADTLAAGLPAAAWQRLSAGRGTKGHRLYDWAWVTLTSNNTTAAEHTAAEDTASEDSGRWWLLVRRNRRTSELAYFPLLLSPPGDPGRAGRCCRPPLNRGGVVPSRQRPGRARPTSVPPLAALAPLDDPGHARRALLAVPAATERRQHPPPTALIALTCNEIRHLLTALIIEPAWTVPG